MVNNESDFNVDLRGNEFKSCFARSVVVNSQHRQKTTNTRQLQAKDSFIKNKGSLEDNVSNCESSSNEALHVRLVKNDYKPVEDIRRFSCHSATNSRRESLCTTRPLPNIPIENIMFQSQIDTLQWQLKQTEASREMYRAVMKQVVSFLDRAHKSLEILGTKMNNQQNSVHRSKSENLVSIKVDNGTLRSITDATQYEDSFWKQIKKTELLPEEIPPEKLSQEAFRLLRTAQSILNTKEPDLANINKINEPEDDLNFISQLAREFPQDNKPRVTSISLSPKLLIPEREATILPNRITRKLSIYSNHSNGEEQRILESPREDLVSLSDNNSLLSSEKQQLSENQEPRRQSNYKCDSEKSVSPPVSSISSTEDESGFSSMNSFQEVGLPISASSLSEETLTRDALLRSMLHDDSSDDFYSLQNYKVNDSYSLKNSKFESPRDSQKLWAKSGNVSHRRSNSTPVDTISKESVSMKVLRKFPIFANLDEPFLQELIHKIMEIYQRKFREKSGLDEPKTEEYMEQTRRHKKRRVDSKPKESQSIPTCNNYESLATDDSDVEDMQEGTDDEIPENTKEEQSKKNEGRNKTARPQKQEEFKYKFWNTQGIAKKKDELRAFITNNEIDVAPLAETFLKASHTLNIPNYITYRTDRNIQPGGGTAILVRKEIKHHSIGTNTTKIETTAVQIYTKIGIIALFAAYSSPQNDREEADIDAVFNSHHPTILSGDLNSKHPQWNSITLNRKEKQLKKNSNERSLNIDAPTEDTRIHTPTGSTDVLDLIILKNVTTPYYFETISGLSSDHLPGIMTVSIASFKIQQTIRTTNWKKFESKTKNDVYQHRQRHRRRGKTIRRGHNTGTELSYNHKI
ncbi:hypothetical protein Trydic_g710 [Trypoxylus dichotomus]